MMADERTTIIARMLCWLEHANPEMRTRIDDRTDIIESRVLESLQVVEFILFLEAESGRTILAEDLDPNDLRTLDKIYRRFFEGTP